MSGHNPTSATADLSVLAHLRSGLVNAAGVTDFGDQAVLLPLAAGIALLLALSGWRRGALAWTAAIGGTLALILLLKLRFFACGHFLPDSRWQSERSYRRGRGCIWRTGRDDFAIHLG